MGQYWIIINIDKRQSTEHLGKLGEFFFCSEPGIVARLVNRESCPEASGEWAGDRVICIGDYADEVRSTMLTSEEKAELGDGSLYDFASENYQKISLSYMGNFELPDGKDWVLRNLTRKRYVRASRVENIRRDRHGRPMIEIDQLLRLYILWSCDPSVSMVAKVDVAGPWAGDRIDIDLLESVEGVEG